MKGTKRRCQVASGRYVHCRQLSTELMMMRKSDAADGGRRAVANMSSILAVERRVADRLLTRQRCMGR
eukprot:scaffold481679_cov37-Prasinocladus_malaysianus.AAC.2